MPTARWITQTKLRSHKNSRLMLLRELPNLLTPLRNTLTKLRNTPKCLRDRKSPVPDPELPAWHGKNFISGNKPQRSASAAHPSTNCRAKGTNCRFIRAHLFIVVGWNGPPSPWPSPPGEGTRKPPSPNLPASPRSMHWRTRPLPPNCLAASSRFLSLGACHCAQVWSDVLPIPKGLHHLAQGWRVARLPWVAWAMVIQPQRGCLPACGCASTLSGLMEFLGFSQGSSSLATLG